MISTYLTYTGYVSDLPQTLARIAAEPDVSTAARYYQSNIGSVKSVDDFLNNDRLFSYAMKAYGLEDMTYAKAFMRKVLTSDLSDSKSFVNKLTDPRFLSFAKAFQFSTDGTATEQPVTAQDAADEADVVGLYSQAAINQGAAAANEAAYYQSKIGSITSVDDLIADPRLLNYALTAYGLDPSITSDATIKKVLTSDLSDQTSYANQLPDPAYRALAAAFSFNADGSVNGQSAQSADQVSTTIYQYYGATGASATPAAAAFTSQYYQSKIGSITSVDQLLGDNKLLNYVLTAYGLDPALQSTTTLREVLTSDLSDPSSFANQQSDATYAKLAAAFNFKIDGTTDGAQSSDQMSATVDLYTSNYNATAKSAEDSATAYYQKTIAGVASVDDLLKDGQLYDYVLSAFGLDPGTTSKVTIERVLESDPSDPGSFVNSTHNATYSKLAAAFNFDAEGNAKTASSAQTNANLLSTIQLYDEQSTDPTRQDAQVQADNTYFSQAIGTIKTVDGFIKDKRLVNYVLDAYGLQKANLSDDQLRNILTSNPLDPKSFINEPENSSYRALATAFNFGSDGNVLTTPKTEVQDRSQIVATSDLYVRQTLEEDAGDENEGVRLALYFQRNAPNITSPYSILADKALLQVTQTALGLPAAMSEADIDVQAAMITKKLDVTDLQDPDKLNKFLARFAALYDVNNSDASQTSPALMLLQGSASSHGIIAIDPIA